MERRWVGRFLPPVWRGMQWRLPKCGRPPSNLPPPPHRLKRLGRGEKELAQSDFQMIPEVASNPFLPRIFSLYDRDGDGYMNAADLRALLESLMRLADEEERYKCGWGWRGGHSWECEGGREADGHGHNWRAADGLLCSWCATRQVQGGAGEQQKQPQAHMEHANCCCCLPYLCCSHAAADHPSLVPLSPLLCSRIPGV